MEKIALSLVVLLLSVTACNTKNDTTNTPINQEIDHLVSRYLELNRFSGVILVNNENSNLYRGVFGLADYENKKSFNNNTTFKVGSITELFTAYIIKDLADQKSLKLTEKISQYIPEIKAEFTIIDLLEHHSGLPNIQMLQEQHPLKNYSTVDYANLASSSPQRDKKSNLNYNILGVLIERVTNLNFQQVVEQYSSELGLKNTYFKKQHPNQAKGYLYHNYRGRGLELQESPSYNIDIAFSSYGLKSTADDLARFLTHLPDRHIAIDGYIMNDGFSYSINKDAAKNRTIIVLSNRKHPVAKEITNSIASIINGEEYQIPLLRKEINIDSSLLKEYAGSYKLNGSLNLQVIQKSDSLFLMMGPNSVKLYPQSYNQFFMKESDASIRFVKDSTDKINKAILLDGFLDGKEIIKVDK